MVRIKPTTVSTSPAQEMVLYAIERIIRSRTNANGQWEYLIKWKDCSESENSWQLVNDLCSKRKSLPYADTEIDSMEMDASVPMDSSDEHDSESSETASQSVVNALNVESNENHGSLTKKRHPNQRENVSTSIGSKENVQQQQPSKKRGRPKLNKNDRTEHDSIMETVQQLVEQHQQPKKRRQKNDLSAANDNAEGDASAERIINRVVNMRKRKNHHEYLVTWTTDNNAAEWIGRDIMITKYAQHLIAYFERITQFKQLTTPTATTST